MHVHGHKSVLIATLLASTLYSNPSLAVSGADFNYTLGYYFEFDGKYTQFGYSGQFKRLDQPFITGIDYWKSNSPMVPRTAKFYTYGLNFSDSILPPSLRLGVCVFKPNNQILGNHLVQVKYIDSDPLPIFELLMPWDVLEGLGREGTGYKFWTIDISKASSSSAVECSVGWAFRFNDD